MFGVPTTLKLSGSPDYRTACSGFISLILKIALTAYFCERLVTVMDYKDPEISSYTVLDNRGDMDEAVSIVDYGIKIFFFFTDQQAIPIPLDPRIGRFDLYST